MFKIIKQMKINTSTHLTILFTFAIIFVVIYLYYTIVDVRKITLDVKKISQDLAKLNNELTEMKKTSVDVNKMFNMNDVLTQELNSLLNMPDIKIEGSCIGTIGTTGTTGTCTIGSTGAVQSPIELDDDDESVDTIDIKKMLNDEPEIELEAETVVEAVAETVVEAVAEAVADPEPPKKKITKKKV